MAILEHDGSDTAADGPVPLENRRPWSRRGAIALPVSWVVPLAAHAIHADWLLVLVLLLGTASLLRVGHTLLDRLVIATALVCGLLIPAGVIFSLWPWHLNPVAIAGFSLTLLSAVGLGIDRRHGRRPSLPKRVRGTDLIIVAAPVVAWTLLRRPIGGKSFTAALPYTVPRHDTINHYSLFDAIHRVGGYQLLLHRQASPYIADMIDYPPGAHYLYALLDIFRRSTTDPGSSLPEFSRYTEYKALGFCLLAMAIPWAARWIAGPSVTGWRRTLICALTASFAVFGQLSTLYWQSFDAEVVGLAFLAVTVAVVARPPHAVHEQILLTIALLTALAYVYGLFLLVAGTAALASLLFFRKRILKDAANRDFAIRVAVVAAGFSILPSAYSFHSPTQLLTASGSFIDFSRALSAGLALIAMAAVLTRAGRRSASWRIAAVTVAASCTFAAAAELYGRFKIGTPAYYSSKLVEAAWVITLCGLGSLALFIKGDPEPARKARTKLAPANALGAVAIALSLAFTNGFPMSAHTEQQSVLGSQGTSPTVAWSRGHITAGWTPEFAAYAKVAPLGDGVPTIIAVGSPRWNYTMSLITAALNHQLGTWQITASALDQSDVLQSGVPPNGIVPDLSFVTLNGLSAEAAGRPLPPADAQALMKVEGWLLEQKPGLRVAVANPAFADLLRQFAATEPVHHLSVVYVPGLPYPPRP